MYVSRLEKKDGFIRFDQVPKAALFVFGPSLYWKHGKTVATQIFPAEPPDLARSTFKPNDEVELLRTLRYRGRAGGGADVRW